MALRLRPCHSSRTPSMHREPVMHQHSHSATCVKVARRNMASMVRATSDLSKHLDPRRASEQLPEGWTIRRMELNNFPKTSQRQRAENTLPKKPLSFEKYKKQYLKTYQEHKQELKQYGFEEKTLKESYDLYCSGEYEGYKKQLEQINPGIIL